MEERRLFDMIGDFCAWEVKQLLHAKRFGNGFGF